MSKIIVATGLQAVYIMTNMSATILRNLISSVFKTSANKVRLSGEINPNYTHSYDEGASYVENEFKLSLYGFSPNKGFIHLPQVDTVTTFWNGNHSQATNEGTPLCDIEGVEKFIFFLIKEDNWGRGFDDYSVYTIHKAPNFKEHWAKIEEEDIERWSSWLSK